MTGLSTARIHSEALQVIQSHSSKQTKTKRTNKQTNKPVELIYIPKEENVRLFLKRGVGRLFIY